MKNITRHTGTLTNLQRLPSSANGNPRWEATVDGYTFLTKVDSSFAYTLPNYEGRKVEVEIGTHYGVLQLHRLRSANR